MEGGRQRNRKRALAALGALASVLALAYAPLFAGRVIYQRDLSLWLLPARGFVRAALAAGQSPFWNPYVGLGLPTLGNPLYGLFYPPNLLLHVGPLPVMANLLLWLHLAAGAAGLMAVLRRLGAGWTPALVGAIAWGLSGFLTSMWTFGILLLVYAWAPFAALGFLPLFVTGDQVGARPGYRALAAVGRAALPVTLALLSGELFLALVCAGFGLMVAVAARGAVVADQVGPEGAAPRPPWPAALAHAGASLALALALAAVSVLPAAAMAGSTERRAPLSAAVAEQGSLHPWRLLELGGVARMTERAFATEPAAVRAAVGGGLQPLALSVYTGGSVMALVALALWRERSASRRLALLLAALAGASLLVALGRYTPVHGIFRWVVRPFAYMRYPEKYLVVPFGLVALLAGLGAQRLLAGRTSPLPVAPVAAVTGALLAVAAAAPWLLPPVLAPHARAGALHGALGALAVLLVVVLVWRGRPRLAGAALVAVVALDLGAAAAPLLVWSRPAGLSEAPPIAARLRDGTRPIGTAPPPRVYRSPRVQESVAGARQHAPGPPGSAPVRPSSIETLRENTGALFGIAVLPGYDAALSPALGRLLATGRDQVLPLVGATHALLAAPAGAARARPHLEAVFDPLPGARLYRVANPLPRVYLAGAARVMSDDQALATGALFEAAVVAGDAAVLARAARRPPPSLPASPPGSAGQCTLVHFSTTHLEARCDAARPALAVFLEQHDPGWRASVDGRPTPVERANLVMRAVPVPAGRHQVTLSYQPPGLRAGASVTLLAAVVFSALLLVVRVKRGRF